jgi:hypothetical protein
VLHNDDVKADSTENDFPFSRIGMPLDFFFNVFTFIILFSVIILVYLITRTVVF